MYVLPILRYRRKSARYAAAFKVRRYRRRPEAEGKYHDKGAFALPRRGSSRPFDLLEIRTTRIRVVDNPFVDERSYRTS